ncbi:guanylate kinase [Paraburkholderia nemoris]|uniref:guanylate kinase n=1 Tax=Paraburkholderia nemoris TaxID=2793076 RepID=UPI0038BA1781
MIVTLTGPSCAGKSTLERMLVDKGFWRVTSHTTRAPRPGEKHEVDYHFVSKSEFKRLLVQGRFVEHAKFGGNYYGAAELEFSYPLGQGKNVVVVMEPQGIAQFKKAAKERGWPFLSVFVNNPVSVIADRYIIRVLQAAREAYGEGATPDPKPHVKRLTAMFEQEQFWAVEARKNDMFDVRFETFDETNAESIVKFILNHVKKEQ